MDGYRADVVSARYTNSFTVTEHRDRQMKKLILIGVGLVIGVKAASFVTRRPMDGKTQRPSLLDKWLGRRVY